MTETVEVRELVELAGEDVCETESERDGLPEAAAAGGGTAAE